MTSLIIVAVIAVGTCRLLRDSVNMSLQATPSGLDRNEVADFLRERPGVAAIHDLHVWPLSTTEAALTVHLLIPAGHLGDSYTAELASALHDRFGIDHATVQIETDAETLCRFEPEAVV